MLGDADRVAKGHLGHGNAAVDGGLKIDMIRSNAGRDGKFQFGCFGDSLCRQVSWPKRLRNNNFCVRQLALEDRIDTVLVGRHHELVSLAFKDLTQPQLSGYAAEQMTRNEIYLFWYSVGFGRRGSAST